MCVASYSPKQSQPPVTDTAPLVAEVLHTPGSGWRTRGSTPSPAGCSSPITWQQRSDHRNSRTPQSSFRTATILSLPDLVGRSPRPRLNKSRPSELVPKPRPHTSHGSSSIGAVQAALTAPVADLGQLLCLGILTPERTSHNQDLRSSVLPDSSLKLGVHVENDKNLHHANKLHGRSWNLKHPTGRGRAV